MLRMTKSVLLAMALTASCQLAACAQDISGAWNSDWGTVYLDRGGSNADGSQTVTGYWDQGAGKRGQITRGRFMPGEGRLIFKYFQPWNQASGTAKLMLNGSSTELNGTWDQGNKSGNWRMTRAAPPAQKRVNSPYIGKRKRMQAANLGGYDNYPAPASSPPPVVAAATAGDISGTWKSDYGNVIFDADSMKRDGTWRISGGTYGSGRTRGQINTGLYNPHTNTIWFKYTNPKGMVGEANLKVHSQGTSAAGTWSEQDGSSGHWNLWR